MVSKKGVLRRLVECLERKWGNGLFISKTSVWFLYKKKEDSEILSPCAGCKMMLPIHKSLNKYFRVFTLKASQETPLLGQALQIQLIV